MPTFVLAGEAQPGSSVSVSLEQSPLVLADVRKALPQLKKELSKRWPVLWIDIENQIPRRRNPYDAGEVVKAACVVLIIAFAKGGVEELGKKTVNAVTKYVQNWIAELGRNRSKNSRRKTTMKQRTRRKLSSVRKRPSDG